MRTELEIDVAVDWPLGAIDIRDTAKAVADVASLKDACRDPLDTSRQPHRQKRSHDQNDREPDSQSVRELSTLDPIPLRFDC